MRKALVLLLLLLVACSGNPPVDPPPPPPVEICGNGICAGTETPANCAADCGGIIPPPGPVCGDGACTSGENSTSCPADCGIAPPPPPRVCGDEQLDPDCAKITRDHTQWLSVGNYCVLQQDGFDPVAYFATFKKFNATSLFLMCPWDCPAGFQPWELDPVTYRYLLDKPNKRWLEKFRLFLRAAGYYDVGVELAFIDRYGEAKWVPMGTFRSHPFRFNSAKIDITGDSAKPLYLNWNRKLPFESSQNWAWMVPKVDAGDNILEVKPTNKLGAAMLQLYTQVAQIAREVKTEFPNLQLRIRPANEPFGITEADGKTLNQAKSFEIDSRTERLFPYLFRQSGFTQKEFRIVYEPECYVGSVAGPQSAYWAGKNAKYIKVRGGLMEWHGVDDAAEYQASLGMMKSPDVPDPGAFFLGSSDGSKEDSTYLKRMNGIWKLKPRHFDFKLLGCYKKSPSCPKPWNVKDMNQNLHFITEMESAVFK